MIRTATQSEGQKKEERKRTKESGNTRLLIVVSPLSPGVVGLDDEQRRCTLFVERPRSARNPPFSYEIRPHVSTSWNRRRSTSLANRGDPRPRSKRRTKRRNQNHIRFGARPSNVGRWNRWCLTSAGQGELIRPRHGRDSFTPTLEFCYIQEISIISFKKQIYVYKMYINLLWEYYR